MFFVLSVHIMYAADVVSVKSGIPSLKEMALIVLAKPLSIDELKFFFQNNVVANHVAEDLWAERLKGSSEKKEISKLIKNDANHLIAIFITLNYLKPTTSLLTQALREKKHKSTKLLVSQNLDLFQEDIYGDIPYNYMSGELLLSLGLGLFQEDIYGNRPFDYMSAKQIVNYFKAYLFSFF
jgi:hypothetical protein